MRLTAAITVTRDLVALVAGTFVVLHEELTGGTNYLAWSFGTLCILGPAGLAVWSLARGNPERGSTPGSSSEPSERSRLPS